MKHVMPILPHSKKLLVLELCYELVCVVYIKCRLYSEHMCIYIHIYIYIHSIYELDSLEKVHAYRKKATIHHVNIVTSLRKQTNTTTTITPPNNNNSNNNDNNNVSTLLLDGIHPPSSHRQAEERKSESCVPNKIVYHRIRQVLPLAAWTLIFDIAAHRTRIIFIIICCVLSPQCT